MAEDTIKLDPIVVKPYDIDGALNEGYTYKDIASHLSEKYKNPITGKSYDLDAAINEGYNYQEISEHLSSISSSSSEVSLEPEKSESYKDSMLDRDAEGNVIGTFDEDTFIGSTINKIIPQPKKIPAQLMRQLGLAGRGGVEGLSEAGDFITSPIRGALNLALPEKYKIKPLTETVTTSGLTSIGIPYAEDNKERIVQGAVKMIPFTGGTNAVIKALNPKSYAGKNIKKAFLENEGKQLLSGAAFGGTSQYVAEEGGGEVEQLLKGFGASLLPFLANPKGIRVGTKPMRKQNLTQKKEIKATDLIDEYEYELAIALKNGVNPETAGNIALKKLSLSQDDLYQAAINVDRSLKTFKDNKGKFKPIEIENAIKLGDEAKLAERSIFDKIIGNWNTEVNRIDKSGNVSNRFRRYDFGQHVFTDRKIDAVTPFIKVLNTIQKKAPQTYKQLSLDLANGNRENILRLFNTKSMRNLFGNEAIRAYKNMDDTLVNQKFELKKSGFIFNEERFYYPRKVIHLPRLYRKLGVVKKKELELRLEEKLLSNVAKQIQKESKEIGKIISNAKAREHAKLKINNKKKPLTVSKDLGNDDKSNVIDMYLRGTGTNQIKSGKPGFTQSRTMGGLKEEDLPFYENPQDVLLNYIRSTQKSIEKRKLLGQDIPMTFDSVATLESSLGRILKDTTKNLSKSQAEELKQLIISRLGKGEETPGKAVATIKDVIYIGTLANPQSSLTQVGDTFQTSYQYNLGDSAATLFGTNRAKLKTLGLDDAITADLAVEKRGTSTGLNVLLKANGFKRVDKFGKELNMNTALRTGEALAKNKQGQKVLKKKWGNVYGAEYDSFLKDLQKGNLSDNVKLYLWHNLADQQPISLSEMPQMYLDLPNGRVFYSLMSFALKQLDIVKRTILNEYRNGNKKKAITNAGRYAAIVGGGNTAVDYTKDAIAGRNINPYNIPVDILFNTLKVFGVSDYAWSRNLSTGNIADWFANIWMPPVGVITAPITDAFIITQKALDPDYELTAKDFYNSQSISKVPSIGTYIKNFAGDGRKKYNERLAKDAENNFLFGDTSEDIIGNIYD